MRLLILLVMYTCYVHVVGTEEVDYNKPLNPAVYQSLIGPGFSTNYFRTLNLKKYKTENIKDVKDAGFKNLRLRCNSDIPGLNMTVFLNDLEEVVDECLKQDIIPIICWQHIVAEAFANETHRQHFLDWWGQVATKLKDKDYRLSFNLYTELGIDYCIQNNIPREDCQAIKLRPDKYNNWTEEVIKVIRNSGGKNDQRIIIMGSPQKEAKGLWLIDSHIYNTYSNLMVEWHTYAAGPYKRVGRPRYWDGDGTGIGKYNVDKALEEGTNFTDATGLRVYFGAWMPQDNKDGSLNQTEMIYFAKYFVQKLKPIPWSLNVLDRYYDTRKMIWIKDIQTIQGQNVNMSMVLDAIKDAIKTNDPSI